VTRCIVRSILIRTTKKALQSSERSRFLPEGGPSSHCAVALSRSEAIGHTEAVHLALGPLRQDHHLLLFFSFAAWASLLPLSCLASRRAMGVAQWFVDFSALIHKLCKSTASFLATATTARFFEFLPPREAIFSP
jgi:hypothetical protein